MRYYFIPINQELLLFNIPDLLVEPVYSQGIGPQGQSPIYSKDYLDRITYFNYNEDDMTLIGFTVETLKTYPEFDNLFSTNDSIELINYITELND